MAGFGGRSAFGTKEEDKAFATEFAGPKFRPRQSGGVNDPRPGLSDTSPVTGFAPGKPNAQSNSLRNAAGRARPGRFKELGLTDDMNMAGQQETAVPAAEGGEVEATAGAPPAEGGMKLGPAAIVAATAATSLINGIMAQRNAAENRRFSAEQGGINRSFSAEQALLQREFQEKRQREQNVLSAISAQGAAAERGAAGQSTALARLAGIFGGL